MNIHETAELIGPPSCIIALDWSEALGARPDPGERGEPGWQRRACPSAGGGRTPAPLPAGPGVEPPGSPHPSRAARSRRRRPRAPSRSSAEGTATPSALLRPSPPRRRGRDGSRAPPASAGCRGSCSCPARSGRRRRDPRTKRAAPARRAARSAGAQGLSARGSQRRPAAAVVVLKGKKQSDQRKSP